LHHLQGETGKGNSCKVKKLDNVDKLLGSLQDTDPLRGHLSKFVKVRAVRGMIAVGPGMNPSPPGTDVFCDAT
jgi:hypothetical protein